MTYYTLIIVFSFCTYCLASNELDNAGEISHNSFFANQEIPTIEKFINHFKYLAQAEIDAYHSCRMAAEAIKDLEIKDALKQIQDDHKKNILQIETEIEKYQDNPATFNLDFNGFATRGFSCPTEHEGDTYILMALESNEVMITTEYDIIICEDIPSYLKETNYIDFEKINHSTNILREQLGRERSHLSYIRYKLRQCVSG